MKKKIKLIIPGIVSIMIFLSGLYWLAIGLLLIYGIILLIALDIPFFIQFRNRNYIILPLIILLLFILAITIRIFIFEIVSIPSSSMENTLMPGDKVLVSKLNYGPSLPRSPFEIPWINTFWYLQSTENEKTDSLYWDFRRLNGYEKVKQGDILVFRHPLWGNWSNYFIKRCMGLPGDTLAIKSGIVFINNIRSMNFENIKQQYIIKVNNLDAFDKYIDSKKFDYQDIFLEDDKNKVEISLTNIQKEELQKSSFIDSLSIMMAEKDTLNLVFPNNKYYGWTIDEFGPLIVPFKSMMIKLSRENLMPYNRTISSLEKKRIKNNRGLFYVNGNEEKNFTFNHDYYFMIGDNRHDSNDSRFWGFVPEEYIIGKAVIVLFSVNPDEKGLKKIRWNRFFKALN